MRSFKIFFINCNCVLAFTLLMSILLPAKAVAQYFNYFFTGAVGGDTCNVRNPTTANAASLRKVDGTIENISDDLTATISCPIPIPHEAENPNQHLEITINRLRAFFVNSHSEEQNFKCSVTAAGDKIIWNSVDLPMSTVPLFIEFSGFELRRSEYAFGIYTPRPPVITCGLPPNSALLSVLVEADVFGVD